MLATWHQSSCCVKLFRPKNFSLKRRCGLCQSVRAAQKDEQPTNKRPEQQQFQSAWDDHLSTQNKQADKYRPPTFDGQDMQASRGKFLGRLAVLILGVSPASMLHVL